MLVKFRDITYKSNAILLLVNLILTYLIYSNIGSLQFRNTDWLKDSNIFEREHDQIEEEFALAKQIIISIKLKEQFFNSEQIEKLKILEDKISDMKSILKIDSPLSARSIFEKTGVIYNKSFYQAFRDKIINLTEYEQYLLSRPYEKLLISDNQNINLFLEIDEIDQDLLYQIESVLEGQEFITNYKFLGDSYLHFVINDHSSKSLVTILFIGFALVYLYILFSFRNILYLNLVIISGLVAIFFTINFYSIFDFKIYPISIILPILMIAISVSDTIFIIAKSFNLQAEQDVLTSYKEIIRKSYKPCLITSLTTLVSFLIFVTSDVIPLYQMSIVAIFSILISYVFIIFIIPFILSYNLKLSAKNNNYEQSYLFVRQKICDVFLIIVKSRKEFILLLSLAIIFLFIFAKPIRYETNFLQTFFKKDDQIMKDFNDFDQKYLGSGNINLVIKNSKISEYHNFHKLLQLQKKLEAMDHVSQIRYYPDIVKIFINRVGDKNDSDLPENSEQLQQSLLFIEFSRSDEEKDIISDYLNFAHDMALVKIFTNNLSSSEIEQLKSEIHDVTKSFFDDFLLSGGNIYYLTIADNLVKTQYISIFFILLTISISIFIFYNILTAFLVLIATIIPIIFIRLFTSYVGMDFDISSIIITSISIGITIDNAIHILNEIELGKEKYSEVIDRVIAAFQRVLLPVIMILIIFLIISTCCYFSKLFIFQKLSLVLSLTLMISFFSNAFLIPILYSFFKLRWC